MAAHLWPLAIGPFAIRSDPTDCGSSGSGEGAADSAEEEAHHGLVLFGWMLRGEAEWDANIQAV